MTPAAILSGGFSGVAIEGDWSVSAITMSQCPDIAHRASSVAARGSARPSLLSEIENQAGRDA